MENTIITKTDKQFGTVRYIEENKTVLYCASDVAKALGYTNPRKAIIDHCRGVTKRDTLTNGGLQPVNFIPECDVYRLICHSKLPDAVRFEKWVFEDIVPKAVRSKQTEPVPEQLTLETAEYHYYDKTYNGQPVISLADFVHLTGVPKHRAYGILMRLGSDGKHYFHLDGASLAAFKQQNPSFPKAAVRWFIVVTKAGFELLMKEFGSKADVPQCFIEENSEYVPGYSMQELMGFLERDIATVDELRQRMLEPSTKSEAERNRNKLVIALKRLKWWYFDTSTIRI